MKSTKNNEEVNCTDPSSSVSIPWKKYKLQPKKFYNMGHRSLSTWVAVGDTSATTQLPSPQVRQEHQFSAN
jgi:hypothetical protein